MPATLQKRSINLSGHATSLALEPEFWAVLDAMAAGGTMAALIGRIDGGRKGRPLASACRVAALGWTQARREEGQAGSPDGDAASMGAQTRRST